MLCLLKKGKISNFDLIEERYGAFCNRVSGDSFSVKNMTFSRAFFICVRNFFLVLNLNADITNYSRNTKKLLLNDKTILLIINIREESPLPPSDVSYRVCRGVGKYFL